MKTSKSWHDKKDMLTGNCPYCGKEQTETFFEPGDITKCVNEICGKEYIVGNPEQEDSDLDILKRMVENYRQITKQQEKIIRRQESIINKLKKYVELEIEEG